MHVCNHLAWPFISVKIIEFLTTVMSLLFVALRQCDTHMRMTVSSNHSAIFSALAAHHAQVATMRGCIRMSAACWVLPHISIDVSNARPSSGTEITLSRS